MNLKNKIGYIIISCFMLAGGYLISSFDSKSKILALKDELKWTECALMDHIRCASVVLVDSFVAYPNTLIYRYSDESCEKCVSEDLDLLCNLQEQVGRDNVLVFPSFPEQRNSMIRLNNELQSFRWKNMNGKFDFPLDECTGLHKRYFLFIQDGTCYSFFPIKGQQKLTSRFFDFVSSIMKKEN